MLTDPSGMTPGNNPVGALYCGIVNPVLGPGGLLSMLPGLFHGQGEGGGGTAGKGSSPRGGVYLLIDPENGGVIKSGRTKDLARRAAEYARDPTTADYIFEPAYKTDD